MHYSPALIYIREITSLICKIYREFRLDMVIYPVKEVILEIVLIINWFVFSRLLIFISVIITKTSEVQTLSNPHGNVGNNRRY